MTVTPASINRMVRHLFFLPLCRRIRVSSSIPMVLHQTSNLTTIPAATCCSHSYAVRGTFLGKMCPSAHRFNSTSSSSEYSPHPTTVRHSSSSLDLIECSSLPGFREGRRKSGNSFEAVPPNGYTYRRGDRTRAETSRERGGQGE